jgi:hypothetical protein
LDFTSSRVALLLLRSRLARTLSPCLTWSNDDAAPSRMTLASLATMMCCTMPSGETMVSANAGTSSDFTSPVTCEAAAGPARLSAAAVLESVLVSLPARVVSFGLQPTVSARLATAMIMVRMGSSSVVLRT